ncbi:hypothetical protein [Pseudomonas putida]|uniref:Uncharacterized protein n=1 Tax=Pseudomonas putida TaxID=303 RepID=A0A8I1EFS0_PSEPU|nr:hypothetical protein [Pseudomonas putida]MBI6885854.1 hypothetical protein [Pseudomonas putida]
MSTLTPAQAKQEIDSVLLAARDLSARHIEIIVRPEIAFIQFSHEEWTKVHVEWTEDHANEVMGQFFIDLKRTQGHEEDPRPEEAMLDRSETKGVNIRARVSTIPLWPEGYDVIINLL